MSIKIRDNVLKNHKVIFVKNKNNNEPDMPDANLTNYSDHDKQIIEEKNYGSWTVDRLKDELRKRKARLTGRKKDLVRRLIKK